MDFALCCDIHAGCGMIEQENSRLGAQPFSKRDFLLISPTQLRDQLLQPGASNTDPANHALRPSLFRASLQDSARYEAAESRYRNVGVNRKFADDPFSAAIFRHVRDSMRQAVPRRSDGSADSPYENGSAVVRDRAEYGSAEFCDSGSDQSGHPQDLARPQLETYVFKSAGTSESLQPENLSAMAVRFRPRRIAPFASNHPADEKPLIDTVIDVIGSDRLAVLQHGGPVSYFEDLAQMV